MKNKTLKLEQIMFLQVTNQKCCIEIVGNMFNEYTLKISIGSGLSMELAMGLCHTVKAIYEL